MASLGDRLPGDLLSDDEDGGDPVHSKPSMLCVM